MFDYGIWALAINFGVSLPTGSGFNTSDGYDPDFNFLYAWDIDERWNLNGNFDFASESQGQSEVGPLSILGLCSTTMLFILAP